MSAVDTRAPEEIVRERAQAYLTALVNGDQRAAYDMIVPAYRERLSYEQHLGKSLGLRYTEGRVVSVACPSEESCAVEVELGYEGLRVPRIGGAIDGIVRSSSQRWVKVDGQWWLFRR
ncbi:hypothetical protein B4966_12840 [Rhodocyclaceae bacterium]|nr:hypothetical protein B4966_12840 [Rhodocyclaceae bacterium]